MLCRWLKERRERIRRAVEAAKEDRLFNEASELAVRIVRSILSDFGDWRAPDYYDSYHLGNKKLELLVEWIRNADHMNMNIVYKGRRVASSPADAEIIRRAYKRAREAEESAWEEQAVRELRERTERTISTYAIAGSISMATCSFTVMSPLPESADSGRG